MADKYDLTGTEVCETHPVFREFVGDDCSGISVFRHLKENQIIILV